MIPSLLYVFSVAMIHNHRLLRQATDGHPAKSNFLFFWFGRAQVASVPGLAGYGSDILCWCTYEEMGDGSRWQPNQQTMAAC